MSAHELPDGVPDLTALAPVVDALGAVRDEIAALERGGVGLLERDEVLVLLRARIDERVFGGWGA